MSEHFHAENIMGNDQIAMLTITHFYISNYSRSEIGLLFRTAFPLDDVAGGQNGKARDDERSLLHIILFDSLSAGNEELFKVLGSLEPVHSMRERNARQRCVGGDEDNTGSHKCFRTETIRP